MFTHFDSMADLDAAESDAQDAQQQLQAQGFTLDKMSASDRNELATEVADRLEFAVQYKVRACKASFCSNLTVPVPQNENTRRLLASLQRIAVLQSHIANMPGLINNLNNDLRCAPTRISLSLVAKRSISAPSATASSISIASNPWCRHMSLRWPKLYEGSYSVSQNKPSMLCVR